MKSVGILFSLLLTAFLKTSLALTPVSVKPVKVEVTGAMEKAQWGRGPVGPRPMPPMMPPPGPPCPGCGGGGYPPPRPMPPPPPPPGWYGPRPPIYGPGYFPPPPLPPPIYYPPPIYPVLPPVYPPVIPVPPPVFIEPTPPTIIIIPDGGAGSPDPLYRRPPYYIPNSFDRDEESSIQYCTRENGSLGPCVDAVAAGHDPFAIQNASMTLHCPGSTQEVLWCPEGFQGRIFTDSIYCETRAVNTGEVIFARALCEQAAPVKQQDI